jgi:nucleotide-binding universal stress UspA family protein
MTNAFYVKEAERLDIRDLEKRDDVRLVAGVRRILAPTDLTTESRNVVNYAAILAKSCDAHLTVLHVYREPYNVAYLRGSPAYAFIERHRQDSKYALESFGEEVRERYADCSTEFRTGIPREEIIQAPKDLQIDMLVISTHGHKWFRRFAYGSNPEELVRRAPCPVLLVHEDEHCFAFTN